jgi:prephenate dehydrogenase
MYAILGTGLIGGSVALGLRGLHPHVDIVGFDSAPGVAERGLARGALTAAARSLEDAVAGAEVVVIATPAGAIPEICSAISGHLRTGAVVTDVASAKTTVVEAAEGILGGAFVGGHPMAGSERHGIEAAHPDLFDDAWWILTPTGGTSTAAYSRIAALASGLGAKPVALDPAAHDALVARLSHIPQLTASALVDVAVSAGDREALLGLAAGGFRDVTRIAASDPKMWVSILRSNRAAVMEALEGFEKRLDSLAEMIGDQRWDELEAWLGAARRARIEMFVRPDLSGEPVLLTMPVLDRPGVLAEVTTAAGRIGANIEDLRIVHSTEGGRGRLELVIAGRGAADALAEVLGGLGYAVERGGVD